MKNYFYILYCLFVFLSCQSQGKNNDQDKQKNTQINIHIIFYPTGVPEDIRYSIVVKNDSIYIRNHSPRGNNELINYQGQLTKENIDSINYFSSGFVTHIKNEKTTVLDTWSVTFKYNGELIYQADDFSLKGKPENIKGLIRYFIRNSPVKIELYGFS